MLDFDVKDLRGFSPLHLAVGWNSLVFARCLLGGGADASSQNNVADQPSHIAARDNRVDMLKVLCVYDEHIGRLNYNHQSPVGLARMHGSKEAQTFLEKHYRKVNIDVLGNPLLRNKIGDLWWEKDFEVSIMLLYYFIKYCYFVFIHNLTIYFWYLCIMRLVNCGLKKISRYSLITFVNEFSFICYFYMYFYIYVFLISSEGAIDL